MPPQLIDDLTWQRLCQLLAEGFLVAGHGADHVSRRQQSVFLAIPRRSARIAADNSLSALSNGEGADERLSCELPGSPNPAYRPVTRRTRMPASPRSSWPPRQTRSSGRRTDSTV